MVEFVVREPKQKKKGKRKQKPDSKNNPPPCSAQATVESTNVTKVLQMAKPFPFLRLPPEVRNQIYALLYEIDPLVLVDEPSNSSRAMQAYRDRRFEHYPAYLRLRYDSRSKSENPAEDDMCFVTPPANPFPKLHLVCSHLYRETVKFLYEKPQFCFQSVKSVRRFMTSRFQSGNLSCMRKMDLSLQTYGQPKSANNLCMLQKSYDGLGRLCKQIVANMPNLTILSLFVDLREWPISFNLFDAWVQPLLVLRKLRNLQGIRCEIWTPLRRQNLNAAKYYRLLRSSITIPETTLLGFEKLHILFGDALEYYLQGNSETVAFDTLEKWAKKWRGNLPKSMPADAVRSDASPSPRIDQWSHTHRRKQVRKRSSAMSFLDIFSHFDDDLFSADSKTRGEDKHSHPI